MGHATTLELAGAEPSRQAQLCYRILRFMAVPGLCACLEQDHVHIVTASTRVRQAASYFWPHRLAAIQHHFNDAAAARLQAIDRVMLAMQRQ